VEVDNLLCGKASCHNYNDQERCRLHHLSEVQRNMQTSLNDLQQLLRELLQN